MMVKGDMNNPSVPNELISFVTEQFCIFVLIYFIVLCCDSEAAQCLTDTVVDHHGEEGCSVDHD